MVLLLLLLVLVLVLVLMLMLHLLLLILLVVHQHNHLRGVYLSLHHLKVLLLDRLVRLVPVVHKESEFVLSWGKAMRRLPVIIKVLANEAISTIL